MARDYIDSDGLEQMAGDFLAISKRLTEAAQLVGAAKMPNGPLLHVDSVRDTYLPEIRKWSRKIIAEVESQIETFRRGQRDKIATDKQRYEQGRKPPKKK